MIFVGFTHIRNKALRIVSAKIDGHVDLLLKIVLILARPWLSQSKGVVLLEEGSLRNLRSCVFAAHISE